MTGEIWLSCPQCQKGNRHFSINIQKKVAHCFKCGYSTKLTKELAESVGLEWNEPYRKEKEEKVEIKLPPKSSWTTEAMRYVRNRNIGLDQIKRHGLYYCSRGYYQHRIIIPINMNGELVGFQARTIRNDEKRYIFPKGFHKSTALYGFDLCPHSNRIVVVEGVFDLFAVENKGYRVLATFGKKISKAQIELVASLTPTHITILYDSDADATEAYRALQRVSPTSIGMLDSGDPAECDNLHEVINGSFSSTMDMDLHFVERVCAAY
jgi:DNA primase